MQTKEEKDAGYKAKATDCGFDPMGGRMCEMMRKRYTGHGGFPDCRAMIKSMMEAARIQPCCAPKTEESECDGGKK